MKVGVVVLHYRFWPEINATLDSLAQQDHPVEHVVVVDNASGDGSAAKLAARSDIEVVEAPDNRGYAAGMNLGVSRLRDRNPDLDAVLLLTHEATMSPDGLGRLVAELRAEPGLGAVGPLLAWRDRPERVYSAGVSIDPRTWYQDHIGEGEPVASWVTREAHRVDSLDGAAVLIRSQAAAATGAIDESYFLYYEEVDYFVRMRRAGWGVACVPAAVGAQSPGRHPQALWVRNRLRFLAANAPRKVLVRELTRNGYHATREILGGQRSNGRERLTGMAAFVTRRPAASLAGRP